MSLASQGFTTCSGNAGIYVQAPQFEGVQNVTFPTFVMGVPITNETQINNTFYASDGLSHVICAHTIKGRWTTAPGPGERTSERHLQWYVQH